MNDNVISEGGGGWWRNEPGCGRHPKPTRNRCAQPRRCEMLGRTFSALLIRHTVFGGRGRFQIPSMPLTTDFQFVTSLFNSVRRTVM